MISFVVDIQHIPKKSAKILLHKNLFFQNQSAKKPADSMLSNTKRKQGKRDANCRNMSY